jgi:hypothetical protein
MRKYYLLVWIAFIVTSCSGPKIEPTATPDAEMVMTSVMQTVMMDLTQSIALTPSATPSPIPSETAIPTETPEPATPTATISFTEIVPTNTSAPLTNQAELTNQSVADNTTVSPGDVFKITWTFKNQGKATWNTNYAAKFASGELMGAEHKVYFDNTVDPGESIDITITVTAPSKSGTYESHWVLRDANDLNFFSFYIILKVSS